MDAIIKHDGLDALRAALSPLVTLKVEQEFSDIITITLTIPDPMQFHPSFLAKVGMETKVVKRFVWADSNRRVLPPSYDPITLNLGEWEQDMRSHADRLLADAQRDPVAFFVNDMAEDLR